MNKEKDGKRNILLRFFAILGILVLLLALTAVSCEKKKGAAGGTPPQDPNPNDQNNDQGCAEEGFTVTLANESFKEAFTFSKFAKDADTGSFDADLTVKLSGLTHDNGFVSNHVWIHPDENKYAMPFEERGILANTLARKPAEFADGSVDLAGYDFKYCGFDTAKADANYKPAIENDGVSTNGTINDIEVNDVWDGFKPSVITDDLVFLIYSGGVLNSLYPKFDMTDIVDATATNHAAIDCQDIFRYGDIIQAVDPVGNDPVTKGKLKVGYTLPAGTAATLFTSDIMDNNNAAIKWDEDYETSMDKTGAYYVRDSFAYKYVKEGTAEDAPEPGAVAVPFVKDVKHIKKNDTDLFYNEVKKAFEAGGEAMADLASVFDADMNMGASTTFLRQPAAKSADNKTTPFGSPWDNMLGASLIRELGTADNGGWQKLFTITPCAKDKMKNGIAVAYGHADKDAADKWKGAPELTFDGTADIFDTPADVARKLIIRRGTSALTTGSGRNNHALLFESVVSPEYNGNNNLGFFTIQHGDHTADMTDAKNAFSTKGVIHCRSALGIADEGTEDEKKGVKIVEKLVGATADKVTVGKFGNKLQGYKDGAISDETKGPGLTCYLGLSALWPDAIGGAEELTGDTKPHKVQFEDADKKDDNKYDFSDKHLGLLMINMPEDVTVNNALLLPIFNQFTSDGADTEKAGEKFKMEATKEIAKSVLKNIKDDSTFGYLHGNVKVTFSKE